jgi:hypothetical protein
MLAAAREATAVGARVVQAVTAEKLPIPNTECCAVAIELNVFAMI